MARQSDVSEATKHRHVVGQQLGRNVMQYPSNNSEPASVGLNAIHPLSVEMRHHAADLIQDKEVLALFHEPLIGRMTKPQGVPVILWDMMTDEHKELVTYKVVSEAFQKKLRRSEGL